MRYGRYLAEGIDDINEIRRACRVILDTYRETGKYLYRGTRSDSVVEGKLYIPREDRKPKNSSLILQEFVNDILYERFGWRPREEGVFCTSKERDAFGYGTPYIVLPVDYFQILWSPRVRDLYIYFFEQGVDEPVRVNKNKPWIKEFSPKQEEVIKGILKSYTDLDLVGALKKGNEVMLRCKGYYLFKTENKIKEIMAG